MGIALLLLPVTLVVLTFPTWAERRSMAHSVAYEAARAVARSRDWVAGKARAEQIAGEIAENYEMERWEVELGWQPDRGASQVQRGEKVTAVVTVWAPGLFVPGLGDVGRRKLRATHTETVDRYRSL
jgi:hypothetical protein